MFFHEAYEASKAECPCSQDENKEDANTDFLEFH